MSQRVWPKLECKYLTEETVIIVVKINGKVRAKLEVEADISEETMVEHAKAQAKVKAHLEAKNISKVIFVPKKLLNFVVN